MKASQQGSGAVRQLAVCAVLVGGAGPLTAQDAPPKWSIAAGTGFVFRTVQNGSFGINLRGARVIPVVSGLYLEPGLAWHGYTSSDWLEWGEDGLCPDPGCIDVPRRDGIGFGGVELGAAYLKPGAANSLHPVGGIGVYRSTARSTPVTRFGANLGVAFPFHGRLRGPGLDIRYFRMFNGPQFKSLLFFSLRWLF